MMMSKFKCHCKMCILPRYHYSINSLLIINFKHMSSYSNSNRNFERSCYLLYSVETTYGIKLFQEISEKFMINAWTDQLLF